MDIRELAKDRLRQYAAKRVAEENLTDEIRELEYRRKSLGGGLQGTPGGKKDPGGREAMLISCIQRQKILEEELYLTRRWLERMERGLGTLTPEERLVLDRFYIRPEKGAADRLVEELGLDVKTVYHRSGVALRKLTTALWGGVEL